MKWHITYPDNVFVYLQHVFFRGPKRADLLHFSAPKQPKKLEPSCPPSFWHHILRPKNQEKNATVQSSLIPTGTCIDNFQSRLMPFNNMLFVMAYFFSVHDGKLVSSTWINVGFYLRTVGSQCWQVIRALKTWLLRVVIFTIAMEDSAMDL